VGDADRRVGDVDVLAAGARGAVGVDAQVLVDDVDLDVVVDLGIDVHRGVRGVAALGGVVRADAHQPVHAVLASEVAVGVGAAQRDGGAFDAGLFAVQPVEQLDLV